MELTEIRQRLNQNFTDRFGPEALPGAALPGEDAIAVHPAQIVAVCRFLRDALGFDFLTDLFGVDRYPREPRFEIVYTLCCLKRRERLHLKVAVPEGEARVPSVLCVWKSAEWHEREVFDMFGIHFDGHPDLRRILLPPDWKGFPLRKDYPLKGCEAGNESKNDDP